MSIADKLPPDPKSDYEQWRKKTMRQFMILMLCLTTGICGSMLFVAVMAMRYYVMR